MTEQEASVPKPPQSKYLLRLPKSVNDAVRSQATEQGTSINNVILMHLCNSMGLRVNLFKRGRKVKP